MSPKSWLAASFVAIGLGWGAPAHADKSDWSSYLEPPGAKAPLPKQATPTAIPKASPKAAAPKRAPAAKAAPKRAVAQRGRAKKR